MQKPIIGSLWTKALVFRAIVVLADFAIVFVLLRNIPKVTSLIALRHGIQTVLYVANDYLWIHYFEGLLILFKALSTIVKTLFFRGIAIINDLVIVYFFTGSRSLSLEITLIITVVNTILYYAIEVFWQRIAKQAVSR